MSALRGHVGAAVDGLRRQIVREAQVRAVRLVDEQQHAVRMDELRDCFQAVRHAVVCRVDADERLRLGMQSDSTADLLLSQAHRDAEALVDLWLQEDGPRACEDDAADDRAVRIARHEDGVAGR